MTRSKCSSQIAWPLKAVTWLVLATQLLIPYEGLLLASNTIVAPSPVPLMPAPVLTPQNVIVNRTVPQVSPLSLELQFSSSPTDAEIASARVFNTPILSLGATGSLQENKDLATALLAYRQRQDGDDAGALESFLQTYPDSPRAVSLWANLASHYRRTCQFTKALSAWQETWLLGKSNTDLNGRQVVDQAVGDWATFLVTLGQMTELKNLLDELKGRQMSGTAAIRISDAAGALWQMEHASQQTFKCGPYSLSRIQAALGASSQLIPAILRNPQPRMELHYIKICYWPKK